MRNTAVTVEERSTARIIKWNSYWKSHRHPESITIKANAVDSIPESQTVRRATQCGRFETLDRDYPEYPSMFGWAWDHVLSVS